MRIRNWLLFGFGAVVIATTLRYLLPGRYGLSFRSDGVVRGIPINIIAFWLALAVAAIITLAKLITERTHR